MKYYILFLSTILLAVSMAGCNVERPHTIADNPKDIPHTWDGANLYFLLTDRFYNADPGNDINFGRTGESAVNRGFMGGDLAGVTQKIQEGYFDELGITAIWMTPFHEQIHGMVDEGTGNTYGYHGYWIKDWTSLDPNFGNLEDLDKLVKTAHSHGIRIVMDVIINHTGPVTTSDPVWGDAWVRTSPQCTYQGYESTISCTLVENLPDIRTESEEDVALPPALLEKWEKEGRLERELNELDAFFAETGYPRAPKYYIIKWLTDYVRKFGINGYRLDTAKHIEEEVWAILKKEADKAYAQWKSENPDILQGNDRFYMVGEVYGYGISGGRGYNFGDTVVDFYAEGLDHLINFEFKYDAQNSYEEIFSKYSGLLQNELQGIGVLNYFSSHDDGDPLDKMRENPFDAATKLLLTPGASQIYYGDESSRVLHTDGANGDAHLRSFMNWDDIVNNHMMHGYQTMDILEHYRKLGQFRKNHPAVGAGAHTMIMEEPYYFKRTYETVGVSDIVVVGLGLMDGVKSVPVQGIFNNGTKLTDTYSGKTATVKNGVAEIDSEEEIVLLGKF
ncbi:MAG: alpha-amylase family glycosyl hydrolase [Bacteroidales bacterium]